MRDSNLKLSIVTLFLLASIGWVGVGEAFAQRVTVVQETREVEALARQGMSALVEYDKRTVEKAWTRYLKTLGKLDTWKGGAMVVLADATGKGPFAQYDLISQLLATTEGTKIFWSMGKGGEYLAITHPDYEKAKKALTDFCRQLYRDDISEQIDEAEKIIEMASRTHDKTVQMGESLKKRLERNLQEAQELVKKQAENRQEAEALRVEIQQNRADQEATLDEIKKVRKVAEDRRAKLQTN